MNTIIILSFIAFAFLCGAYGQNNSAIDSLENILRTAKADTAKVDCLNKLSSQYRGISDYKISMQYAESALELAITLDYKKGIANSYSNIGDDHLNQHNFPEALENYFASVKIKEEIGDKRGIANTYNSIGNIYQKQGNYPEAIEIFISSLKIKEEIGDKRGIASTYNNIGNVYLMLVNYREALENYFASVKIKEEIGDKKGIASTNMNIGYIYQISDKYEEALENYLTSLSIFKEIGDKRCIAGCYNSIGSLYGRMGNYPESLENYLASLKIKEEIGDKEGIVNTYINIGLQYQCQGNFQDARKYFDDGLALAEELGIKERIRAIYNHLYILDQSEGNFKQALEHYKMYTRYSDSLFNKQNLTQIALMKTQYENEKKDREIELLNKDNEIKALQLSQQEASLRASRLEAEKNQNELLLMNNSMEIQQLKLDETQKDLEQQKAEVRINAVELELLGKEKMLTEQQLGKQTLVRNGMIAGVFLIVLVGLLIFRGFRLRKKLEKQQAIIQERKRISSDLHDDIGSGLSRIMLLSELMKKEAKTPESRKEAERIAAISHELSSNINEIVWALNANNDYVENLVAYIRRYASEYFENSSVKLSINTPVNIGHAYISGEHRRNIFYAVKEALHNIIKHAMATEARLEFTLKHNVLSVVINDNGKGFNEEQLNKFGNGLNNMRNRMKNINGHCTIENQKGARIILTLPV